MSKFIYLLIIFSGVIVHAEDDKIKVVGKLISYVSESWHTQDLHIIGDDGEEGITHLDLISPQAEFKLIEPEKYKDIEFCIYFSSEESQSEYSESIEEFEKKNGIKVFSFNLPQNFLDGDYGSIEAGYVTELNPIHNKAGIGIPSSSDSRDSSP